MFLIDLIYVTYNFIKSLLLLSLEGRHQTLVTTLGSLFKGLDSFGGHAKVSEQQIIHTRKSVLVSKKLWLDPVGVTSSLKVPIHFLTMKTTWTTKNFFKGHPIGSITLEEN
jgi:hypothetical protein